MRLNVGQLVVQMLVTALVAFGLIYAWPRLHPLACVFIGGLIGAVGGVVAVAFWPVLA